jgi:hypothetical protein
MLPFWKVVGWQQQQQQQRQQQSCPDGPDPTSPTRPRPPRTHLQLGLRRRQLLPEGRLPRLHPLCKLLPILGRIHRLLQAALVLLSVAFTLASHLRQLLLQAGRGNTQGRSQRESMMSSENRYLLANTQQCQQH